MVEYSSVPQVLMAFFGVGERSFSLATSRMSQTRVELTFRITESALLLMVCNIRMESPPFASSNGYKTEKLREVNHNSLLLLRFPHYSLQNTRSLEQ
ncbi:hypothetical protein Bpfe_010453 [Biomphalaria pfeifferi]|uniref:Uncharacterized protein n=1 Tax=Biomphalaria pfeifferi TaxID=112525 RepID=A0AAD8BSW9_BIOPF|nr:hypothetical protein Bpfe_010453 [Biomphalaria pfeifferi]